MNGILQRDVLTLLKKNQTIEGEFFSAKMYRDFLLIKTSSTGCLSNASLNGGLKRCSAIINYSLYGKEDCDGKPAEYLLKIVEGLEAKPGETVGLLTAVNPEAFAYVRAEHTHCFISLGLDNAASPLDGLSYSGKVVYGTINTIILTDFKLTGEAYVDAFKTSVEAKAYSLMSKNIKSRYSEKLATGTITDVTAIVSFVQGEEYRYAGTGTDLGSEISKLVYSSISGLIDMFYAGKT